ncbi:hypothetical protein B0O80DRAFT_438118 [Mortierella sp. GBAus27b]|nr:hypothetical protein BGX31_005599 [Mortierella sp. GBA43]KAI8361658.1 hypothetical protein B0O80DRAFT_438118 [Mortierella sp. GBAus27b]
MKVFSVAAALLALTAIVSAQDIDKRLVDVSDTEMTIKEVHDDAKPNVDTFIVSVQRTDDLLADDGTFLAERVMSIGFNFDVQNHEVLINKVPLPLGDSEDPITVTMTVEAAVTVGPAVDPETSMDTIMNAFDTGLVTVQVTATTEFITVDDILVRHVTLQETIVEVNGQEIVQTNAAQQLLEIMPDGSLGKYTPLTFGNNGCAGKLAAAKQFFRSIHWPALLVAALASLSMFAVTRRIVQKRRQARYARIQQEEASEDFVQVAIVDNKKVDDEKKALN